jgi:hypothetical protein
MFKAKHAERGNREEMTVHENTYEEWRSLLERQGILSQDGKIDLEKLEKKYPGELDTAQVIWIERMQKGEVLEDGDDVVLEKVAVRAAENREPDDEPAEPVEEEPVAPKKKAKVEKEEEEGEKEEEDEDLTPPPLPGESKKKAEEKEKKPSYEVGQTLNIQVEADGDPEEVTITKIAKDGIHLASSKDEDTEYLVDPDELGEMVV